MQIETIRQSAFFRVFPVLAIFAAAATLGGCWQNDQIERYTVEKPPADETSQRLWGAIIVRGSQCWFFKVIGPADAVAPHAENLAEFVESIRFGDGEDATPGWELPEGWRQEPGGGMRLATIKLDPDEPSLEMSVIPLPLLGPDADAYVLSNVNRWRQQVGLPALDASQLPDESKRIDVEGGTAIVVDVTGTPASDGAHPMRMAPRAGGGRGN